MTTLYGIPNCDTIKRARQWLENQGIAFQFHNYRKDGVDLPLLDTFEAELGWENMLNKRGTSWRKLPDSEKQNLNREVALKLLLEHPAMIKRPILQMDDQYLIGFSEAQYQQALAHE